MAGITVSITTSPAEPRVRPQALRLALVAVVGVIAIAGPARAQEAGPESSPLPYVDYVARLGKSEAARDAVFERLGATPTASQVIEAYGEMITLGTAEQQQLASVVPEPCYAAAHEELLAYRESAIELIEVALPRMAESGTVADIVEVRAAIDVELHGRHPSAYVEGPGATIGFGGTSWNIMAALAACEQGVSLPPTDPEREKRLSGQPNARVVVGGAYSLIIPGDWRYELENQPGQDLAQRSPGFAPVLHLWADAGSEGCQVEYGPNDGDTLESLLAAGRQHPEFELGYLDLPAGRAVRISGPIEQAGLTLELIGYVLFPGPIRVQIWCSGLASPDDGWLSIAETFEFLPDEQLQRLSRAPTIR